MAQQQSSTMTVEQAQAIVARYSSTEQAVEDEYQARRVAAFQAMVNCECARKLCEHSATYRALMIEQAATFKARVADIYEDYPRAYATVRSQEAANARAKLADDIDLIERIAYESAD